MHGLRRVVRFNLIEGKQVTQAEPSPPSMKSTNFLLRKYLNENGRCINMSAKRFLRRLYVQKEIS